MNPLFTVEDKEIISNPFFNMDFSQIELYLVNRYIVERNRRNTVKLTKRIVCWWKGHQDKVTEDGMPAFVGGIGYQCERCKRWRLEFEGEENESSIHSG